MERRPEEELLLLLLLLLLPRMEFFLPRVDELLLLFLFDPPITPPRKLWLFPKVLLRPYVPVEDEFLLLAAFILEFMVL